MKRTVRTAVLLLIGFGIMAAPVRMSALEKPEVTAQKADETWLALVDTGKYAESWKAAAAAFQAGVSEEKWEGAAQAVRLPLGKVEKRKLKDAVYTRTLPGAPDGKYVVAHYDTSFEHKRAAVETVVATLDKDGMWRVTGYFIK